MVLTERDMNVPRKTPQSQSKLPRRVATPPFSTPISIRWGSSVADRVVSAEKSAQGASKSSGRKGASITFRTPQSSSSAKDKPLPNEKPLPSRPIAHLSSALSPSKDSRSLIDAHEEPLRRTCDSGEKTDWPALRPQSTSPSNHVESCYSWDSQQYVTPVTDSPNMATPASVVAAAATLTNLITGRASHQCREIRVVSPSPPSSYASANEDSPIVQQEEAVEESFHHVPATTSSTQADIGESTIANNTGAEQPPAGQLLRNRISFGGSVNLPDISLRKRVGSVEFTRVREPSPALTDTRPHSPSPASFSRPRPGSLSNGSVDLKRLKTASRIPIPDSKRATLIDVKKNRESPLNPSKAVPSFGSRRLASPEALRILENGKMRRQLKRMPNEASLSRVRAEHAWELESNATASTDDTPSLSYSLDTSPDGTLAPSSPQFSPMAGTPKDVDEPLTAQGRYEEQQEEVRATTSTDVDSSILSDDSLSEEDERFDTPCQVRGPPPTSPFTLPLQTIPSEAQLPVNSSYAQDQSGSELNRTLSCLEGKGSPPKTEVDRQTLLTMFGHLKRGLDKNTQNSVTLAENAAMAEKYLAERSSAASATDKRQNDVIESSGESDRSRPEQKTLSTCKGKRKPAAGSKWSDSTPSDNAASPPTHRHLASQREPSKHSRKSAGVSKASSNEAVSIGYPSCVATTSSDADTHDVNEPAVAPHVSRRRSSPTLGKEGKQKHLGSVKTAREGIKVATASYARTTASADSRKIARMPTPNTKAFSFAEPPHARGRQPSGRHNPSDRANASASKMPRPRSRSRYVLDKINDIFSGKRGRKSEDAPPVPRIEQHMLNQAEHTPQSNQLIQRDQLYTTAPSTPTLPKMPSMSPCSQIALQSSPLLDAEVSHINLTDSLDNSQSVENLSEQILGKAQQEANPHRKARLLNFAKVLNDSLISAREAQISAETALHAAKSAQMSYEMTQKSLFMLQKLAATMARSGGHSRR